MTIQLGKQLSSNLIHEPRHTLFRREHQEISTMRPAKCARSLRFAADLLRTQVSEYHFGKFLFSFISDSSIVPKDVSVFGAIITIIFGIFDLLCAYCIASVGRASQSKIVSFVANLIQLFMFTPDVNIKEFFRVVPFYVQIVILLLSCVAYFSFHLHRKKKFQGVILYNFFLHFCLVFSAPLLNYNSCVIISALVGLIVNGNMKYFICIVLGLLSVPALMLGWVWGVVTLAIQTNPLTNSSVSKVLFSYLANLFVWVCLSIICFVEQTQTELLYFVLVLIFFAGLSTGLMVATNRVFISRVALIVNMAVPLIYAFSAFIAILQIGYETIHEPTWAGILVGGFCVIIIGSIIHATIKKKKAEKMIRNFEISDLERLSTRDVNLMFVCDCLTASENLAHADVVKEVIDRHSACIETCVFALRYLLQYGNETAFVFETAVTLLMRSSVSFLVSLELCSMIEVTSERVLMSETQATSKQKQLDFVISQCCDAQYEFWQAVLRSAPAKIIYCISKLNMCVRNAESFCRLMRIDEHRDDQYSTRYIDFVTNISCNIALLDVTVLESKAHEEKHDPILLARPSANKTGANQRRITASQSMVAPARRRGSRDTIGKLQQNPQEGHLEGFPMLQSMSRPLNLCSPERVALCKAAARYRAPRQRCHFATSLIVFILSLIAAVTATALTMYLGSNIFTIDNLVTPLGRHEVVYYDLSFRVIEAAARKLFEADSVTHEQAVDLYNDLESANEEFSKSEWIIQQTNLSAFQSSFAKMCNYVDAQFNVTGNPPKETVENVMHSIVAITDVFGNYVVAKYTATEKYSDSIHEVTLYHMMVDGAVFALLLITVIAITIKRAQVLKKVSYQPLLIPKCEVARVYDRFSGMSSKKQLQMKSNNTSKDTEISMKLIFVLVLAIIIHFIYLYAYDQLNRIMCNVRQSAFNMLSAVPISEAALYLIGSVVLEKPQDSNMTDEILGMIFAINRFVEIEPNNDPVPNLDATASTLLSAEYISITSLLQDMAFYPLSNSTCTSSLIDRLHVASYTLTEAYWYLEENLTSPHLSLLEPIVMAPNIHPYLIENLVDDFGFKKETLLGITCFMIVVYLAFEIILFAWGYSLLAEINQIIELLVRICTLLPNNSPFTETDDDGNIDFCRDIPPPIFENVIEVMPVGVVFADFDEKVTYQNRKMEEMFHDMELVGHSVKELPFQIVGEDGETRFFMTQKYPNVRLPVDEFGRKFTVPSCYIIVDVTERKRLELQINFLSKELDSLYRFLIPPTISDLQQDRLMMFGQFAIVEISFSEGLPREDFEAMCKEISKISVEFSTLLYLSERRWSYYAVFGGFSAKGNGHQFVRESFTFVTKVYPVVSGFSKISLTNGTRCLCKIDDSEHAHLALYSQTLMKSTALLRCCDYGEVVSEWSILKCIPKVDSYIRRSGMVIMCRTQTDFFIVMPPGVE